MNYLAIARGIALFLGAFSLFNVFGDLRYSGLDANLWWIDLRPLPGRLAGGFLAYAGVLLVLFAIRPALPPVLRLATQFSLCLLLGFALYNVATYYLLLRQGVIQTTARVPFSVHVACCLGMLVMATRIRPPAVTTAQQAMLSATATVICLVGFPLGQMYCFGNTDYRRPADAIVVFGCKVNSNDRPSWALYDRVRTACQLHAAGLAPVIIMSGGPGEGQRHETDVMKELAMEAGVPESSILVDRDGLDTGATARSTIPMFREKRWNRVIAVSHFYHLPRIKLTYRRAGFDVLTVPARQTHRLTLMPFYLAREVAALWVYYFRPSKSGV